MQCQTTRIPALTPQKGIPCSETGDGQGETPPPLTPNPRSDMGGQSLKKAKDAEEAKKAEEKHDTLSAKYQHLRSKAEMYERGYAKVDVLTPNEAGKPQIHYKVWNQRETKAADLKEFAKEVGGGLLLGRDVPEYALTIAIDMEALADRNTPLPAAPGDAQPLLFFPGMFDKEDPKASPTVVVVDGNHRHELLCGLEKENLDNLSRMKRKMARLVRENREGEVAELKGEMAETRELLAKRGYWLAKVYDLSE